MGELILNNWDTIAALIGAAIAVVKLTKWGRAKGAVLDAVVNAIEWTGASDVKSQVAKFESEMNAPARAALRAAVRKVDPK